MIIMGKESSVLLIDLITA